MDIKVSVKLKELGQDMAQLSNEIRDGIMAVTAQLAQLTYNRAVEMTATRLHKTRQQYVDALHLVTESEGVFVVFLDAEADHLEDGYPPFPMLPKLATGPNSKPTKDGKGRYAIIPIRQDADVFVLDKSGDKQDLAIQMKRYIDEKKWKTVKEGKSPTTGKYTSVERYTGGAPHPYLQGLTRVREYANSKEEKPLSSAYITFRVASTKQDPNKMWRHPGFAGAQIFPDLERWADMEMTNVLKEFFEV